jgi:DNA invertase Pin-like site-specific DNA recombinase
MAMNLVNFAQYERELISERTKAGLAAKKRRGERIVRPRVASASVARRITRREHAELNLIDCCAFAVCGARQANSSSRLLAIPSRWKRSVGIAGSG